ncbi:MAG TPA: hypothetical protein VGW36_07170 [Pyrinomonadaceae bacterium]|nr:hypothetical protein [Pyrinomonadaceae bacterium]
MRQRVEYFDMTFGDSSARIDLEKRLLEVENRLDREMRARGFDPAQHDNLALTGPLAKLYTERENLRVELESLVESDDEDHEGK